MEFSRKLISSLLMLVLVRLIDETMAEPRISWYYQGIALTSNTTVSLNVDDTFTAQCKGAANAVYHNGSYMDFYITKSAPPTEDSILFPQDSLPGIRPTVSTTQGTFVYNTFDGHAAAYEHWAISIYFNEVVNDYVDFPFLLSHIIISRLSVADAGTYYCAFFDASESGYSADSFASSVGLTILVTTKTSGAQSSMAENKMARYSLALLSAYKVLI